MLCDTLLALAVDLMDVDGVTQHTRTNPHGNIFHFLSFRRVEHVAPVTAPSSDFAWFETLEWSIACCATCGAHVGWSFQRGPIVEFWGLLNAALQRRG